MTAGLKGCCALCYSMYSREAHMQSVLRQNELYLPKDLAQSFWELFNIINSVTHRSTTCKKNFPSYVFIFNKIMLLLGRDDLVVNPVINDDWENWWSELCQNYNRLTSSRPTQHGAFSFSRRKWQTFEIVNVKLYASFSVRLKSRASC